MDSYERAGPTGKHPWNFKPSSVCEKGEPGGTGPKGQPRMKGLRKSMSEIQYRLEHPKCKTSFWPSETVRLFANEDGIKKGYRYQDLMIGQCRCGDGVFAYIGLNDLGEPVAYEAINKKKHSDWSIRKESHRVRPMKQKLDTSKYSPVEMDTVQGFIYDQKSGKYFPRILAVR